MVYYVYKITNKINGKVYIGKRRAMDPESDPYMGSGKLISAAITKYGVAAFNKEIMSVFDTDAEAATLEQLLVTKEFVESEQTYNLHEGGFGGFAHINNGSVEHLTRCKRGGSEAQKKLKELGKGRHAASYKNPFVGLQRELAERARLANLGSMFINNGSECKKIKKTEHIPSGWVKGRLSRGQQRAAGDPCKVAD